MTLRYVLFLALLLTGMLAGTALVIWIEYNPAGMSGTAYTQSMQHAIRVFTVPLPILVGLSLLSTAVAAVLARRIRPAFHLFGAASLCILIVALVTAFGNVPINNQIKTWEAAAPPAVWADLSVRWWRFQSVRVVAAVCGAALMILGALSRERHS